MQHVIKIADLKQTVIDGGYCIGCGACKVVSDKIEIKLTDNKMYQAHVIGDKASYIKNVCPFADGSKNEDELGKTLFGGSKHINNVGYYTSTYAGYAIEKSFRQSGSSGGLVSWILCKLISNKMIDGVIHVKPASNVDGKPLFSYAVSNTIEEVSNGAKSRYYPIELSEVLSNIQTLSGTYAVVGVPCFIKAIRLLQLNVPQLKSQIKFTIGLVCGHLKSANFANMWALQSGIHPSNLYDIDFRHKIEGYGANQYGVSLSYVESNHLKNIITLPLFQLYGANWGWGLFKYKACDYCDDVFAETADIVIGDAWLPQYEKDSNGTNVVVVRNIQLDAVLKDGLASGSIYLDELSIDDVIKSQEGGIRHRRNGLSYRLSLAKKDKIWVPKKRVEPCSHYNEKFREIIKVRMAIAEYSHMAFEEAVRRNSFDYFVNSLSLHTKKYGQLTKVVLIRRIFNKIKKYLGGLL